MKTTALPLFSKSFALPLFSKSFALAFFSVGCCFAAATASLAQPSRSPRLPFQTDTVMVHDPVMAFDSGTYYLLSTGRGLQWATSPNRRTWTVQPTPFIADIPAWTRDSVPGFRDHVWAPDIIHKDGLWWLAYSCSTFGKNTSAIGLMAAERISGPWRDCGPIVCSKEGRDNWNAIDPNFIVDDKGTPWLCWGSFWDGIQLARLDHTMHLASAPLTIARRMALSDTLSAEPNPTSKHAGRNAIEAPFIFRHGDYYYLFVSWDYCCRGEKSTYRVAVGRSHNVDGPYLDRNGRDMRKGGGTLVLEGDRREFEAAGHSAAYHFDGRDIFICHGYYLPMKGASILVQRDISWTADGWPQLAAH